MSNATRWTLALLVIAGAAWVLPPVHSDALSADAEAAESAAAQHATVKAVAETTADIPFHEYDFQAEQRLIELANQSRAQQGLSALASDDGLSQAARIHAQAMVAAHQLSHQFDGEPALPQRLAAETHLQLDQEGENVAFDYSADDGHKHLMLSPPHRANLLNPAYNVIGLGVVRSGDRLYIVEDFGHALPVFSLPQAKQQVSSAVNLIRKQASQRELQTLKAENLDDAACSMAQADKLGTAPIQQLAQRYTLLTFTSLKPESLPDGAAQAIARPTLRSYAVGACYARTNTYPTGVYWLVLALD
jgi:uncharacterized protein YkwD